MTLKENLCNTIVENNVSLTINVGITKGQSMIGIGEFKGPVVSLKINSDTPILLNPYKYFSKDIIDKEIIWVTRGDNTVSYFIKDNENSEPVNR
jgi:hypothetical protein